MFGFIKKMFARKLEQPRERQMEMFILVNKPKKIRTPLVQQLEEYRIRHKMLKKQMAYSIGVHPVTYGSWLSKEHSPRKTQRQRAHYFLKTH